MHRTITDVRIERYIEADDFASPSSTPKEPKRTWGPEKADAGRRPTNGVPADPPKASTGGLANGEVVVRTAAIDVRREA